MNNTSTTTITARATYYTALHAAEKQRFATIDAARAVRNAARAAFLAACAATDNNHDDAAAVTYTIAFDAYEAACITAEEVHAAAAEAAMFAYLADIK